MKKENASQSSFEETISVAVTGKSKHDIKSSHSKMLKKEINIEKQKHTSLHNITRILVKSSEIRAIPISKVICIECSVGPIMNECNQHKVN